MTEPTRVYVVQDCSAAGCTLLAIFSTPERAEAYRAERETEYAELFPDDRADSPFRYEVEAWIVDAQEANP